MQYPGTLKAADYRTGASSVINILKDGRWGRAPETYGECPVLTGDIAVAFNKGEGVGCSFSPLFQPISSDV